MCSLKVLEPHGSPTRSLLQLLAERECTLKYLLGCLQRMGHALACQVLSSAGRDGAWGPGAQQKQRWGEKAQLFLLAVWLWVGWGGLGWDML